MIFIFKHFSILIKDRLTRICELANRNCNHVEAVPGQSGNQDDYRDHAYPKFAHSNGSTEKSLLICSFE